MHTPDWLKRTWLVNLYIMVILFLTIALTTLDRT